MLLTPSIILTGKIDFLTVMSDSLSQQNIYRAQWKRFQILEDISGISGESCIYLFYKVDARNVKENDMMLLKDPDEHQNNWPTGIID